jgi:dihydrofolate synthase/folylpolyglutamate synthase
VPHADFVFYTRPVYSRAADPETLMVAAAPFGKPGRVVVKLSAAIDLAKKEAGPQDLIVVCGSLFTVGEALAYLNPGTYGSVDP